MSVSRFERRFGGALVCAAVLLLVRAGPAGAEGDPVKACFEVLSNAGQRECLQQLYRTASARLDEALVRAIARAGDFDAKHPPAEGSPSLTTAISKSQSSWQAYRDAECWGVVGYHRTPNERPAAALPWAWSCLAEKTLQRIRELDAP
jgi:uncharacterized protein YecT (DUF1311 family)